MIKSNPSGDYPQVDKDACVDESALIIGKVRIGKNCFIGFGSVVFRARLGNGVVIKHLAVVEGIEIPQNRLVKSHKTIANQEDIKDLGFVDKEIKAFTKMVVKANLRLVKGYKRLTGKPR